MTYFIGSKPNLFESLKQELKWQPMRTSSSLEISLACVIVLLFCLAYRIPMIFIACYTVFMYYKDNTTEAIANTKSNIIGSILGSLVLIPILQICANHPESRIFFIALITFIGMFCSQTTALGPMAASLAFVISLVLALVGPLSGPNSVIMFTLSLLTLTIIALIVLAIISLLFGNSPESLAKMKISRRKMLAYKLLRRQTTDLYDVDELLDEGLSKTDRYLQLSQASASLSEEDIKNLAAQADASYRLLAVARAAISRDTNTHEEKRTVRQAIKALRMAERGQAPEAERSTVSIPFWAPDTLTNPKYIKFATKSVIAVLLAYFIFTGMGDFKILTALTTVFMVSLGTMAETFHKISLRICGCIIGASLGFISIIFTPNMTDVGQFAFVVGVVCFIAAWISLGSMRISYAGWQIAYCYFYLLLDGFEPIYSIDAALNRVLGISIGIIVVSFIFIYLWPEDSKSEIKKNLKLFQSNLKNVKKNNDRKPYSGRQLAQLRQPLSKAINLNALAAFEATKANHGSKLSLALNQYYDYSLTMKA